MTDSILNAINDANRTLDEWPDTVTDVTVEVPIVALRWLVHAASMHYTTNSDEGRKCNRTACINVGTSSYGELWLCTDHRRSYPTPGLTGRGEQ